MKTVSYYFATIAVCVPVLFVSGCGPASDRPELGLVTGTVTLNGEPLSDVVVVFKPDYGRPARGKTDTDGKYELTYIGRTRGCKVGHNRVEIAPTEEGEEDSEDASNTENVGPAARSYRGPAAVPARYNSKSELEAEVQPGSNTFDFALRTV